MPVLFPVCPYYCPYRSGVDSFCPYYCPYYSPFARIIVPIGPEPKPFARIIPVFTRIIPPVGPESILFARINTSVCPTIIFGGRFRPYFSTLYPEAKPFRPPHRPE